jgi:hypothetical protein
MGEGRGMGGGMEGGMDGEGEGKRGNWLKFDYLIWKCLMSTFQM